MPTERPRPIKVRRAIKRPKRRSVSAEKRKQVYARDGHTCWICGRRCEAYELTVDHVVPLARGGNNKISNLKTACRRCNLEKADA